MAMLLVFFVANIIHLAIGCKWQNIHDDSACFIMNNPNISYGQHFTKDSCLDRCSRESVTYCSFVEGLTLKLVVAGCNNKDSGCCIGSDHCEHTISGGHAEIYECIPTLRPTPPPTHLPTLLTYDPTVAPSNSPSQYPTLHPSDYPTHSPTYYPTAFPTRYPTSSMPTNKPSTYATLNPVISTTFDGTQNPLTSSTHLTDLHISLIIFGCLVLCTCGIICAVQKLRRMCLSCCTRWYKHYVEGKDIKSISLIQATHIQADTKLCCSPNYMNEPQQITTCTFCDTCSVTLKCIAQKQLLQIIGEIYATVQETRSDIEPYFIHKCIDIHHDILSNHEQYQSFMATTNHSQMCKDESCVSFRSGDDELIMIARCQILDTIHCSHRHPLKLSKERCLRYSQLHQTTVFRAQQFDLGRKFIYHGDNEQKQSNLVCPKAKFSDLKDELIHNDIARLTIEQYQIEVHKAACYLGSNFMKKSCHHKTRHRIPEECVLVLMIYCNFYIFQREYSKTYREEWRKHDNFFFFAKTLKEAVLGFGSTVRDGTVNEFYHGVCEVMVPSEIVGDLCEGISIYGPLSSSSSFSIAQQFAGGDRSVIMTLGGIHSSAKYYPVHMLSDYPYEWEYLFLQNDAKIELLNIHLVSTGHQFDLVIEQLKTFDVIMCQSNYRESIGFDIQSIRTYIAHKLKGIQFVSQMNEDDAYGHQLMDAYFHKKHKLIINCSVLQTLYHDLFDLFCDDEASWIKVKQLLIVFPNIEDITIKGISLSEFIMTEIYETHRAIFDPNSNDLYSWTLKRITLYVNIANSSLTTNDAVLKYNGKVAQKNTPQLNIYQRQNTDDSKHHILVIEAKVAKQQEF
eukprot:1006514_1